MDKATEIQFSELVRKRLAAEEEHVRDLWIPIAEEFNRGGPDAAQAYLEATLQQLEDRVQNLLKQVEEG